MPKSPYSDEFKSEAIKQIMEDGHGVLEVSRATGVSDVTLYKWLKAAGWKSGETKEKRKHNRIATQHHTDHLAERDRYRSLCRKWFQMRRPLRSRIDRSGN